MGIPVSQHPKRGEKLVRLACGTNAHMQQRPFCAWIWLEMQKMAFAGIFLVGMALNRGTTRANGKTTRYLPSKPHHGYQRLIDPHYLS